MGGVVQVCDACVCVCVFVYNVCFGIKCDLAGQRAVGFVLEL